MQLGVVLRCRCFVAQQVAIRARIKIGLVAGALLFADGKGNGAVGMLLADSGHKVAHTRIGKIRVLATLQHEGAKAQPIALGTAGQNLLLA